MSKAVEPDLFERIHHWITRVESSVLVVLLLGLIALGLGQILARQLAWLSLPWAEDAMRSILLWLVMIASAVAAGHLRHLRISLVENWLAPALMRWINRVVFLLTGGVCLLMTWLSLQMAVLEYQFRTAAFLDVPTWVVQMIVPVCFGMMAARFLAYAVVLPGADSTIGAPAAQTDRAP